MPSGMISTLVVAAVVVMVLLAVMIRKGMARKKWPVAKFKEGRVVHRKGERHPRVMIEYHFINGEDRTTNAKLHLPEEDEDKSKYIYFDKNPNPKEKGRKGAFYKVLRNDRSSALVRKPEYRRWKVTKEGMAKMKERMKEQRQSGEKDVKKDQP